MMINGQGQKFWVDRQPARGRVYFGVARMPKSLSLERGPPWFCMVSGAEYYHEPRLTPSVHSAPNGDRSMMRGEQVTVPERLN